jgi:hypothetical protein
MCLICNKVDNENNFTNQKCLKCYENYRKAKLSIAKSLEQKENGTANMAILKSRFGKDGLVFEDIIFNNGTIQIEMNNKTNNAISVSNLKSNNTNKAMNKVSSLMDAALKAREGNSEN